MISNAPTNGAHVMSDSTGMPAVIGASSVTRVPVERGEDAVSSPELGPDEEEEHAEGDAIHVVLRLAAQHVEHAVDEIAIDPSDEAREPQDERPVEAGVERVEAVGPPRHIVDRPEQ